MQGNTISFFRKRAPVPGDVRTNQLALSGFEAPFEQKFIRENRWLKLANDIPWNGLVEFYL